MALAAPALPPNKILALDLGKRCGFCVGLVGAGAPASGAWVLGGPGEPHGVILNNLVWALQGVLERGVDMIVKEENRALRISKRLPRNEESVILTDGLHGIVLMMGTRYGVRVENASMDQVRKHFLGVARMGDRDTLKDALVHRAQLLGYMPKGRYDHDRADAVAVWDYSCSLYGRRAAMYHLT